MADTKNVDPDKGVAKPAEGDEHPITVNEMNAAHKHFSTELGQALAEQAASGSNGELENLIAKLKTELQTLERDIKEREAVEQQSGIRG